MTENSISQDETEKELDEQMNQYYLSLFDYDLDFLLD